MSFALCCHNSLHLLRVAGKHILLVPFGFFSLCLAFIARFWPRPVDIGIGPEPLINQRGHKLACMEAGYSAETFVTHLFYYTSNFDYICRQGFLWRCLLAWRCLFRYRALYFYFKGGPFAWSGLLRLEPWIYRIAGTKTLVMGYGGDCQDWNHCPNLPFKHGMNMDYPHVMPKNYRTRQRIDRWTRHASYILSGCDWVYYTPRWNALCLAHFTVDTVALAPSETDCSALTEPVIVLHAPNHETIKGSRYIIQAVNELKSEGYAVELDFVRNASNEELHEHIRKAHIVADQLVIGWYGMFAVEAMSTGKAVLCHLKQDLLDLYEFSGLISAGEIPIITCTRQSFKQELRELLENRQRLVEVGRRSREFVLRHHSISAMAKIFDRANRELNLK